MTNNVVYEGKKIWTRPRSLEPVDQKLVDPMFYRLITLCTPYGTEWFIIDYIQKQPFVKKHAKTVIENNLLIWVGGDKPQTLFSAHMDIVGEVSKLNKEKGTIDLLEVMESPLEPEYFFGAKRTTDNKTGKIEYVPTTLGADDKVGVFILLKMIEAEIPGLYVFHAGEERGGIGSKMLATKYPNYFEGIKRAIAYDRAGYTDIIGRQHNRQCASKKFMQVLADDLNQYTPPKMKFQPDITGSFTDTASYMDIIPECTNISAGYFNQHGTTEHMDYAWVKHILLPIALKVKYDELPTERDPKAKPVYPTYEHHHHGSYWSNYARNNNFSGIRETWTTVTDNTPKHRLPEYDLDDGWVDAMSDKVMLFKYVVTTTLKDQMYTEVQKDKLVNKVFAMLEYVHLLEEEIAAKEVQIAIMGGDFDELDEISQEVIKKELIIPDDKEIIEVPFDDVTKEVGKDILGNTVGSVNCYKESPLTILVDEPKQLLLPSPQAVYTGPDMHIFDKKHLIENLAAMCNEAIFSDSQPRLKKDAPKFARGSIRFLQSIKDINRIEQISKKKLKKMNQMIFHMAFWLNNSANLNTNDRELLNMVAEHIIEHQDEQWISNSLGNIGVEK